MALFGKKSSSDEGLTDIGIEENFSDYVDSLLGEKDNASEQKLAPRPDYTIDQAVALMRKMPEENQDLVVTIVRDTLQSADIDVEAIINDAENKSSNLQQNVTDLKAKIDSLRGQIQDMEEQIQHAEQDLAETQKVRALLHASVAKRAKAQANETAKASVAPTEESSQSGDNILTAENKNDSKTTPVSYGDNKLGPREEFASSLHNASNAAEKLAS